MSATFSPGAYLSLGLYDTKTHFKRGVKSLGSPCRRHPEIQVTNFTPHFAFLSELVGSYTLVKDNQRGRFRLEPIVGSFDSDYIPAGICLAEFAALASRLGEEERWKNQGFPIRFGVYVKSGLNITGPFSISWDKGHLPTVSDNSLTTPSQSVLQASSASTQSLSTLAGHLAAWVRARRPYFGRSRGDTH